MAQRPVLKIFFAAATHCVALVQHGRLREEGEAVPRPYESAQ
jgi:hypothetical protein